MVGLDSGVNYGSSVAVDVPEALRNKLEYAFCGFYEKPGLLTRRADASQKIAERKQKAISAFHFWQVPC